jgi:hypothetical protein
LIILSLCQSSRFSILSKAHLSKLLSKRGRLRLLLECGLLSMATGSRQPQNTAPGGSWQSGTLGEPELLSGGTTSAIDCGTLMEHLCAGVWRGDGADTWGRVCHFGGRVANSVRSPKSLCLKNLYRAKSASLPDCHFARPSQLSATGNIRRDHPAL